jgi:hypothetical protein
MKEVDIPINNLAGDQEVCIIQLIGQELANTRSNFRQNLKSSSFLSVCQVLEKRLLPKRSYTIPAPEGNGSEHRKMMHLQEDARNARLSPGTA